MSSIKLESEYDDLDKYKDEYETIYYCKKNTNITHNPYGPAIIGENGAKFYHIEDILHRLDGPAIIHSNGKERYLINGYFLTKEQFEIHPERLKFLGKQHLICLI